MLKTTIASFEWKYRKKAEMSTSSLYNPYTMYQVCMSPHVSGKLVHVHVYSTWCIMICLAIPILCLLPIPVITCNNCSHCYSTYRLLTLMPFVQHYHWLPWTGVLTWNIRMAQSVANKNGKADEKSPDRMVASRGVVCPTWLWL